jgi:Proline dehydrogenase
MARQAIDHALGSGRTALTHTRFGGAPLSQGYLVDTPQRLACDMAHARAERFVLGVKVVRGAYIVQVRARGKLGARVL